MFVLKYIMNYVHKKINEYLHDLSRKYCSLIIMQGNCENSNIHEGIVIIIFEDILQHYRNK